jgi:hypothetical protein
VLGFIASLPPGKRQPNLIQRSARIPGHSRPADHPFRRAEDRKLNPLGLVQSRAFNLLGSAIPVMITWPEAIPGNYRLCAGNLQIDPGRTTQARRNRWQRWCGSGCGHEEDMVADGLGGGDEEDVAACDDDGTSTGSGALVPG